MRGRVWRHCEQREAIQLLFLTAVDCFVAPLLAMTAWETPATDSRGRGVLDRPVKPDDDSANRFRIAAE
jgi:hypothetical protein